MRGQAADYDHWRQLGLTGWGWDDVRRCSSGSRIISWATASITAPAAAGASRRRGCRWDVLDAVGDAAVEMGIPRIADFNTGDNEGIGYFHVNQKRGRRWSAARGFLKPVLNRPNLRLETDVLVDRLVFDGKRAVGVRFRKGGETGRGARPRRSHPVGGRDRFDRRSCIAPASARRLAEAASASTSCIDAARRRAQSAGPSAAARDLQGLRRAHAERDLSLAGRPRR